MWDTANRPAVSDRRVSYSISAIDNSILYNLYSISALACIKELDYYYRLDSFEPEIIKYRTENQAHGKSQIQGHFLLVS